MTIANTDSTAPVSAEIVAGCSMGIIMLGTEGRIKVFNPAAGRLTGVRPEHALGRSCEAVFGGHHFEGLRQGLKRLPAVKRPHRYDVVIHPPDGPSRPVDLRVEPLRAGNGGDPQGILMLLWDQAASRRQQAQSTRSERLHGMSEMAVKIAHHIRNPLGSIELLASGLQRGLFDAAERKGVAQQIVSGAKRINNIITNLLLFIQPSASPATAPIDVRDSLRESLTFARYLTDTDGGVRIETAFSPTPLVVNGDATLLTQVALNLILNALQAMSHGGRLILSAQRVPAPNPGPRWAEIVFSDTGEGIAPALQSKIFDPFYTTRQRGTGLGLAIVHAIVAMHGGTIDVTSTPGKGTRFTIRLPLAQAQRQQAPLNAVDFSAAQEATHVTETDFGCG
jgi:PAS domain S-box-containing protein